MSNKNFINKQNTLFDILLNQIKILNSELW